MSNKDYIPKVNYAHLTTKDPNPIKRILQNLRLTQSTKLLSKLESNYSGRILDFGAGNAELLKRLANQYKEATFVAFEPALDLYLQAQNNLNGINNVKVIKSLDNLFSDKYDFIFCMEVFEHLPDDKISESLALFNQLLNKNGNVIIGVPNELFIAALLKGIFRMIRRFGAEDANFKNIIKATLGMPIKDRKIVYIDENLPYMIRHIGFDYRRLETMLKDHFIINKRYGSPFPLLSLFFNFEIYILCIER